MTISRDLHIHLINRPIVFWDALINLSSLLLATMILFHFANKSAGVFFTKECLGKNKKTFKTLKFKMMTDVKDAKRNLLPDADRLTLVGRFMRSTSIDELSQLM